MEQYATRTQGKSDTAQALVDSKALTNKFTFLVLVTVDGDRGMLLQIEVEGCGWQ